MRTPYEELDLALVPGPLELVEPAVSFDLRDVTEYPPVVVAEAFLAVPNTVLTSSEAGWWGWSARHAAPDGAIEIDFSLFDTEPVSWGGSSLRLECGAQSLLKLWLAIRERCPAVWLQDTSCKLYSPESFSRLYF